MDFNKLRFVEVAADLGARTRGSSLGTDSVLTAAGKGNTNQVSKIPRDRISANQEGTSGLAPLIHARWIDRILDCNQRLADHVCQVLTSGSFPFVMSGDHSGAIGPISGLRMAFPGKRTGLIWIDAHFDIHTPFTSHSGNMHGMPIGCLLNLRNEGEGSNLPGHSTIAMWESLCNIGGIAPKIRPEDIVFIGVRDFEEEELRVIRKLNICQIGMDEIIASGVAAVAAKTLDCLSVCDQLYLSFDIDSLDKELVPGTGTPVGGGLSKKQAETLLLSFSRSGKLAAMEFSEIDPKLDENDKTVNLAAELITKILVPA